MITAAAMVVALAVVGVVSAWNVVESRDAAREAATRAQAERERAVERGDALVDQLAEASIESDPTAAMAWLRVALEGGADPAAVRLLAESVRSRGVARHVLAPPGPARPISAVAGSPDGAVLAAADARGGVHLWDSGGGWLRTLEGPEDRVARLAFSADGRFLVAASKDGTARRWTTADWASDRVVRFADAPTIRPDTLSQARISANGRWVALTSTTFAGSILLADLETGAQASLDGHGARVVSLRFTEDGERLASGSRDDTVRIWRTADASEAHVLEHPANVTALRWSPTGAHLATTCRDGRARVYRADGTLERTFVAGLTPWSLEFTASGDGLVTSSFDRALRVFDLEGDGEGRVLATLEGAGDLLTRSPDRELLAVSEFDGVVSVVDSEGERRALRGQVGEVADFAFWGETQIVTGASDGSVRVWSLASPSSRVLGRHEATIFVYTSADGSLAASSGYDGRAVVYDVGAERRYVLDADVRAGGLELLTDGAHVASTLADGRAFLWAFRDGVTPRALEGSRCGPRARCRVRSSPGATRFTRVRDGSAALEVWDVETAERRVLVGESPVMAARFLDEDTIVAATASGEVRRWSIDAAESVALADLGGSAEQLYIHLGSREAITPMTDGSVVRFNLDAPEPITLTRDVGWTWRSDFDASGERVATASMSGGAFLFDLGASPGVRVLHGHRGTVRCVRFFADGRTLATSSSDRTVRLWDVETGASGALFGHRIALMNVERLAPDAEGHARLVSGDDEGVVRLWTLSAPRDREALGAWIDEQTSAVIDFGRPLRTPTVEAD